MEKLMVSKRSAFPMREQKAKTSADMVAPAAKPFVPPGRRHSSRTMIPKQIKANASNTPPTTTAKFRICSPLRKLKALMLSVPSS
jgi:hypothetical protein